MSSTLSGSMSIGRITSITTISRDYVPSASWAGYMILEPARPLSCFGRKSVRMGHGELAGVSTGVCAARRTSKSSTGVTPTGSSLLPP